MNRERDVRVRLWWALPLLIVVTSCDDGGPAGAGSGEPNGLDAGETLGAEPSDTSEVVAVADAAPEDGGAELDGDEPDRARADAAPGPDAAGDSAHDAIPSDADTGLTAFEQCFAELASRPDAPGPDYDQFGPVIASHCAGTDHQEISDIERVVFLGDSVTVGTPPTADADFYRSILAGRLADTFDLQAPGLLWRGVNWVTGTTWVTESGDFAACAVWGARTDDLLRGGEQLAKCFADEDFEARTLIVMTVGGNDLAALTEGFMAGESVEDLWAETAAFVDEMRASIEWLTAPGRFPNGVDIIFTNLYEFTDATGDVTACPTASLAGFEAAVEDPALAEMVVWAMESFMSIAVDTGTDMLFLLESFCGHGYNRDDPAGRCYRGPDAELWFDLSCIHPNPTGHAAIADLFMAVVLE